MEYLAKLGLGWLELSDDFPDSQRGWVGMMVGVGCGDEKNE